MYTKVFPGTIFVILALAITLFTDPPRSEAAYDPTSQSWGIASATISGLSGCVVNRMKAGNALTWFTCSRSATGTVILTFLTNFFATAPICELTAVGAPLVFGFASDPTTSSATINMFTLLNIASDGTFFIHCR